MDPLSGKVKGFLVGGTQFHDVTRDLSRLHHSSRDPHKIKRNNGVSTSWGL